ncbi:hypothetical protein D3C76_246830 [compost metagenome]
MHQQRFAQAVCRLRLTGEVGHQARATDRGIEGQHHCLAYAGNTHQAGFDLTRFDAQAANLHLVIVAA